MSLAVQISFDCADPHALACIWIEVLAAATTIRRPDTPAVVPEGA